jgi:hypothetical protein
MISCTERAGTGAAKRNDISIAMIMKVVNVLFIDDHCCGIVFFYINLVIVYNYKKNWGGTDVPDSYTPWW